MRTDAWLFIGIIIFFFVLWVYAGGPNNPISFSGPYITPITNVRTTQVGYGPSANDRYTNGSNTSGHIPSGTPASAQAGEVRFTAIERNSGGTVSSLRLHSYFGAPISITGWQLLSAQTGARSIIPQGVISVSNNGVEQLGPIVLGPGQDAIISDGATAYRYSYLDQSGVWHIFLPGTPFRTAGDTVQLLDANGMAVDRTTY